MTEIFLQPVGRVQIWFMANGNLVCSECGLTLFDGRWRDQFGTTTMDAGMKCPKKYPGKYDMTTTNCIGVLEPCGRPVEDHGKLNSEAETAYQWFKNGKDPEDGRGANLWQKLFTDEGRETRKGIIMAKRALQKTKKESSHEKKPHSQGLFQDITG